MGLFPPEVARGHVQRAAHGAEPWIERLARLGYASRGLVYITVGGLALQVPLQWGGRTTGSEGALRTLLQQPFGKLLLAVVAVGLIGYCVWRFVQAGLDPERNGTDAKGLAKRAGYVLSALIHLGLALEAGRMLMGGGGGGSEGDEGARHWTAMLMQQPFGRWLVALVGVGIAALGLFELYRAFRTDIAKRLSLGELSSSGRRWVVRAGRLGFAARGVVFGLIAAFLVEAAWRYDSSQARGLGGALSSLRERDQGRWMLGVVAAGLIAYGVFELVKARYRRIDPG